METRSGKFISCSLESGERFFGGRKPAEAHLRIQVGSLLHQRADSEPEAVSERERVDDDAVFERTRVRVLPLVRAQPRDDEDCQGDEGVGREDVEPDVEGEGVHEGKESGSVALRHLERQTVRSAGSLREKGGGFGLP